MKNNMEHLHNAHLSALPTAARQRLLNVSLGWLLVAGLEAFAYTMIGLGIVNHWSPNGILASAGLAIFVTVLVNRSGYLTGVRLAGDLYATLGHALARTKLSWFTHEHRSKIARMAGQSIPGFMSIPAHQLQSFLHAPCLPLCLVIGIGAISGLDIALMACALLVFSLTAQFLSQQALKKADAQRDTAQSHTSATTLEFVDHLELLRTAAGPVRAIERLEQRWNAQEQTLSKTNLASAFAIGISTLASVLPMAGIAAFMMLSGHDNPATLLAVLILTGRASAPLGDLANAGLGINDLKASLHHFQQTIAAPQLAEPSHPKAAPKTYDIDIDHVSQSPVLNSINARIPAGSRVNISGPSGSGKSTFLELLMRFDDPDNGGISIGSIPLKEMPYEELASLIAYAPQDPVVFTGSLADNIRIGNPKATDQEIEAAARLASLDDLISRSTEGIHQPVGQQGSALSGGERQRVALARALIKQAPILILDEATSALDEKTEHEIIAALDSIDATLIFVTHRDATLWHPNQTIDLAS